MFCCFVLFLFLYFVCLLFVLRVTGGSRKLSSQPYCEAMNTHDGCQLARAAVHDGILSSELAEMASCGASGSLSGNEFRDFHRLQSRKYGAGFIGWIPSLDYAITCWPSWLFVRSTRFGNLSEGRLCSVRTHACCRFQNTGDANEFPRNLPGAQWAPGRFRGNAFAFPMFCKPTRVSHGMIRIVNPRLGTAVYQTERA